MSVQPHADQPVQPALDQAEGHPPEGAAASEDAFGMGQLVEELRASFDRGITRSYSWRLSQLEALQRMLEEQQDAIIAALGADLGKPALEAYTAEVGYTLSSILIAKKKLRGWMSPDPVASPLVTQPARSQIHKDPLGVVLIIAPWNYPFQLAIGPLLGAIAAGNCTLIKPSEVAPETSALIKRLVQQYLDGRCIKVVEGGVPETTAILKQRFDHIFYTGNGHVGRIVMTAAAKHLTPVTLELGGKSPCIIDREANIDVAVKRIAWGKWSNAGQTCVAPDYLLVHRDVHDEVISKMQAAIVAFWGENAQQSADYGRVVNSRHHARLMKLLDNAKELGAQLVAGGDADEADRYIAPTVLTEVPTDSDIMQQEIFGPILPVLRIDNAEQAISFINRRDKPLALYVFSENKAVQKNVVQRTSSGGVAVNHTWLYMANHDLPFGGVGESGMGAYHGKASFDTFTHHKSVFSKPTIIDPPLLYPPYTDFKKSVIRKFV